ncbi:hypothetical protein [Vibrio mediterranei]|uniref:hypothetical protein n=1 Tax=Vibrio mediterranei TaxID=689 RepID=UPI00148DC82F|nr:hypothetical protein [Vibrio mediterranei]NOI26947.1 hypothetical protein [Vibrio mediterranei]
MPTFNVTYFTASQTEIEMESIFMKSLANAKRSAIAHAPDTTHHIVIKDVIERELSRYEIHQGWTESPDQ